MRAVPITALAASPTVPIATEATVSTAVTTAQPASMSADAAMSASASRRIRRGRNNALVTIASRQLIRMPGAAPGSGSST